jgi:hypothetical protein
VKLSRGQELLTYTLSLDGFEPIAIKIIPDQDKPVLVPLRAEPRLPSRSARAARSADGRLSNW